MTFSLQNQVKKYTNQRHFFSKFECIYVDTIAGPSLEKGALFETFFILILTRAPLL